MIKPQPVYRFAPSPNGELHLGHAFSALLNLKLARENGGKMLLRIEDIDTIRCTPEREKQMLKDLEWIGFEWDEEPRRQSEHFEEYQSALQKLDDMELLFPSILSRGQIKTLAIQKTDWPSDPDGVPHYPGNEHQLSHDQKLELKQSENAYALRLDIANVELPETLSWHEQGAGRIEANPSVWGKPILGRKDFPASYHICCVVDDALQGITNIVRGRDLYHATSLHCLLQHLLKIEEPVYRHHALILDEAGQKLSKSTQSTSLAQLREQDFSRERLLEKIDLNDSD